MQLKEYQQRAIRALEDYFDAYKRLGKASTAFYKTTEKWWNRGIEYNKVIEIPGLPYVCLRIPTGGGKTFVACHCSGLVQRKLLGCDHSVILWLVPSNTILEQTLSALKDRKHPYRQALESGLGAVDILNIKEALYVQRSSLDSQTVIIVSTVQAFRVEDTDGRKVYEQSGHLQSHFTGLTPLETQYLDCFENGEPITSFANVLKNRRPIVLVDEAHNARTELSFDTLARFNPSCILEFTATPDTKRNPSNVLYSCSAAELKAEEMIKLPIRLETRFDWKDLLSDAIKRRNYLENIANREQNVTGEYIRPIMLLQAQPQSKQHETLNFEVLKDCLVNDLNIPQNQIAIATGTVREIEGIDLAARNCEIRYIITVKALGEGWDCPNAYVLYSVANLSSRGAVEQILGRILRLPNASRKTHEELNYAYAFASSTNFSEAAKALTDALVENGFERQEAKELIIQAKTEDLYAGDDDLFGSIVTVEMSETPDLSSLSKDTKDVISFNLMAGTMTVRGVMNEDVKGELLAQLTTESGKAAVEEAYWKSKKLSPQELNANKPPHPFSIPVLAIQTGDLFEQFEETHLLEYEWRLSECESLLSEQEYSTKRPEGGRGEIDITNGGKIEARFLANLENQISLLGTTNVGSEADLIYWLDRTIPHQDISPDETGIYLISTIRSLINQRGFSLDQLTLDKFRLRKAIESKVNLHRLSAKGKALQEILFANESSRIKVGPDLCFTYDPEKYPDGEAYRGHYSWNKHFFPKVGKFDSDEELDCAKFIDQQKAIKHWVRNISNRPSTSFWLQTSTDRFYPDFVCELEDGRFLVVEYKGKDRYTTDDSKEKKTIGDLWEKRSEGKCLFVMTEGKTFDWIRSKVMSI